MAINTAPHNLTVPTTSINDGIPLHTWRLNIAKAVANINVSAANISNAVVGPAYAAANQALSLAELALTEANLAINIAETALAEANAVTSPPGANTQIIYNSQGSFGACQNLTFTETSLNVIANLVITGNGSLINVNVSSIANLAGLVSPNATTWANGTIVVRSANVNYNNTATVNVGASPNGAQSNIVFTANIAAIVGPFAANANAAYGEANAAYAQANSAYAQGNLAYTAANSAQTAANSAANTAAFFANGTLVLVDANLNFNNTATVNVGITANGTTQVNAALTVNTGAVLNLIASGNTANLIITPEPNGQYQLDTRFTPGGGGGGGGGAFYTNGAFVLGTANANINFNNTASVSWTITANGATQVNVQATSSGGAGDGNNYQADLLANGTVAIANANVNFNNTATVNVAVTANAPGQGNVSFTANSTALGIVALNAAVVTINTTFATHNTELVNLNTAVGTINTTLAVVNTTFGTLNTNILAAGAGIWANGTLTQGMPNANVNFNNTATVNVATAANGVTQVNVSFSANGTALGIPTINATLVTINTTFGTLNTEIATLNTATGTMNGNFGVINTTFGTVNTTFSTINSTFATVNTELTNLNAAAATINTSLGTLNTTFGTINTSLDTMNTAIVQAGNVQVFVNGVATGNSVNGNINFVSGNTSNLTLTGTLNTSPGNATVTIDTCFTPGGGGGGSPGGTNNSIQINNLGAFSGNARFTMNLYRGNDSTIFLVGGSADSPFSTAAGGFSNASITRLLTQNIAKGAVFLEFANDTSNITNTFGYFGGSATGMRFSVNELTPFNITSFSVVTGAVNTYASFTDGTATFYNSNSVQSRISIQSQAASNSAFLQFNKAGAVQGYLGVAGSAGDLNAGTIGGDYVIKNFQANANINMYIGTSLVANISNSGMTLFGGATVNNTSLLVSSNASTGGFLGAGNVGPFMLVDSNTAAAGAGNTNIDFNNSLAATSAKGRISVQANGSGSFMRFGTSNSYASGITNEAIIIDQNGLVRSNCSPLSNVVTSVKTGIAVSLHANVNATSASLTSIAPMAVNLNEIGVYFVHIMLLVASNNTVNTAVGYLFDWGGGSATIPKFFLQGTSTNFTTGSVSNLALSARTGALANVQSANVAIAGNNPDAVSLCGSFQVTAVGTFAPRIACVHAGTAANTVVLANSAMVFTKIS